MTTFTTAQKSQRSKPRSPHKAMRVLDIIIAAILGVAGGLLIWVWNYIGGLGYSIFDAITPGLGGLAAGLWITAAVVGGLVIRKPGAALFVEVIGAFVSFVLGSRWGIEAMYAGVVQGLGAELAFALLRYRRFGPAAAVFAGMLGATAQFTLELFTGANLAKSPDYLLLYLSAMLLSGAVLAGGLGYVTVRALAATGALDQFPAGRDSRTLV